MKNIIKIVICLLLVSVFDVEAITYNFNDSEIPSNIQTLLNDVSKTWPSNMDPGRVELIIQGARLMGKGITYGWGAGHDGVCEANPTELDCSGYVSLVYNRAGINSVVCDWYTGTFAESSDFVTINESDLLPGDIGLNNLTDSEDNHIGIYIGKQNGENRWFHSTSSISDEFGMSGPQVRNGNQKFKSFMSYTKWNEVVLRSQYNAGSSGIGGSITGRTTDAYPSFANIESSENFTCKTIFYYKNAEGVETKTDLKKAVDAIFLIIKIVSPTILIVLTIMDRIKNLFNVDSNSTKKINTRMFKRVSITLAIVMIPYILELIFRLYGLYDLSTCM